MKQKTTIGTSEIKQTRECSRAASDAANTATEPTLRELQSMPLPPEFQTLTGLLRFPMTNDALFHIVFEANPYALKGLTCALLRLAPEEIASLEVTNPIEFGSSVYAKSFVLDLKILLNNRTVINIEMQVENLSFWRERSVGYLCRAFDSLNRGDSYLNAKPAIHIGILDFDLLPEQQEFYATYHLLNDVTHKKYSDSLRLSVLQLKHTELATQEDRLWQLDLWAKFFKAKTWEEIRMIAEKNPYIADAAGTIYRVTEDDRVRSLCEGREEGEKTQRTLELLRQMAQLELQETQDELQQANAELQQKDAQLAAALAKIAELEARQK